MGQHHDTTGILLPRPVFQVAERMPTAVAAAAIVERLSVIWGQAPAALVLAAEECYAGLVEHLRAHLRGLAAPAGDPERMGEALRSSLHGGDTLICGGYFLAAETPAAPRFAPALLVNLGPGSRLLREPLVRGPFLGVARAGGPAAVQMRAAVAGPTQDFPLRPPAHG